MYDNIFFFWLDRVGGITFGGANVVKADLYSSQGVIHAIDEVILTTNEGMTDTYADNKQDHY